MSVAADTFALTPQGRLHDDEGASMSAPALAQTREPFPLDLPGLRFDAVGRGLWRVSRPGGAVLGHVERQAHPGGERFCARRMAPGAPSPRELGEFWSPRDAAECFR
jgi:hypothetical protein